MGLWDSKVVTGRRLRLEQQADWQHMKFLQEKRIQMKNSQRREKEIRRGLGSKALEGDVLSLVGSRWHLVLGFVIVVFLLTTVNFLLARRKSLTAVLLI